MTIDTAHLRRLLAEATSRPWYFSSFQYSTYIAVVREGVPGSIGQHVDAALACAAVNALPALLDRVEALESDLTSACMSAQFATDAICDERDLLATRVAKLEAALRRYGHHEFECRHVCVPCTCGLDTALEKP